MFLKKKDGKKILVSTVSGMSTVRVHNPRPISESKAYKFFEKYFEEVKNERKSKC